MSGAGSFLSGFASAYQGQKDRAARARDLDLYARERAEDRALVREERSTPRRSVDDYQDGGGGGGGGGGDTRPFRASDPVNTELAPHRRAFLNAVAGGESGGLYNVRYTPKGGANFDLAGGHPRVFEPGPHGKSSAAGRYQFTWTTWKGLAGADTPFTAANQDRYAWDLAQRDYKARTGRDLDAVLQQDGLTDDVMETLTPTWQAFKGNRGRWASTYQDSLARLSSSPVARRSIAPMEDPAPSASALSFGPAVTNPVRRGIVPTPSFSPQ